MNAIHQNPAVTNSSANFQNLSSPKGITFSIRKWFQRLSLVVVASTLLGNAKAALVDVGDGTIFDSDTSLLWLKDWNVLNSSGNWADSDSWAQQLSFASNSDWELPTRAQFQTLFNNAGSFANLNAIFTNIQSGFFYWTKEEQVPGSRAYIYKPSTNFTSDDPEGGSLFRVAVTTGVPEPTAATLLVAGLFAMGGRSRSRKQ